MEKLGFLGRINEEAINLLNMIEGLFIQLSLIIVIAVVISVIMRALKQPLIIGYILTGILVGPYFLNIAGSEQAIATFSKFGITFLLFVVGLSLDPSKIKKVGFVSLLTGLGQIIFTSGIGFLLARSLGFGATSALYIAGALTFSSTIIIVKLLSDKKEMSTLHGRIMVGFLVVQDIIAALLLMIIPLLASGQPLQLQWNKIFLAFSLLAISIPFGAFVLSPLSKKMARAQELLFLFSIGWVLLMALIVNFFSIPIEVGALLAGITLAAFPFSEEMKARMKPLRDFFLLFFFVWIGTQMVFTNVASLWPAILVLSLFVLIGNPLIIMLLMKTLHYSKRTGFLSGLTGAQISEFSLILMAMGVSLGHLQSDALSLVTAVGLITISVSTYLMIHSHKIYGGLSPLLGFFERGADKVDAEQVELDQAYDAILFGCDRIGHNLLEVLQEVSDKLLIVDYNPEVVEKLSEKGFNAQYGDAKDPELINSLDLEGAEMVITTTPDFEANSLVIGETRERNEDAIVLAASYHLEDTIKLYEVGASYVFLPHLLVAKHATSLIQDVGFDQERLKELREDHLERLEKLNEEDFDYQYESGLLN